MNLEQTIKAASSARFELGAIFANFALGFVGLLYLDGATGNVIAFGNFLLVVVAALAVVDSVRTEHRLMTAEAQLASTEPTELSITGLSRWSFVDDPGHPDSAREIELSIRPDEHGKQAPLISAAWLTWNGQRIVLTETGKVMPDGSIRFQHILSDCLLDPEVAFDVLVAGR